MSEFPASSFPQPFNRFSVHERSDWHWTATHALNSSAGVPLGMTSRVWRKSPQIKTVRPLQFWAKKPPTGSWLENCFVKLKSTFSEFRLGDLASKLYLAAWSRLLWNRLILIYIPFCGRNNFKQEHKRHILLHIINQNLSRDRCWTVPVLKASFWREFLTNFRARGSASFEPGVRCSWPNQACRAAPLKKVKKYGTSVSDNHNTTWTYRNLG